MDITNERIVEALVANDYRLKLKVLAIAQAIAWHDLPKHEQKQYERLAQEAYTKEMAS